MNFNELKLYIINGSTLGITMLPAIENWLKLILLVVTIGYTASKWLGIINKNRDEKDK